jgi:hypothetical protein
VRALRTFVKRLLTFVCFPFLWYFRRQFNALEASFERRIAVLEERVLADNQRLALSAASTQPAPAAPSTVSLELASLSSLLDQRQFARADERLSLLVDRLDGFEQGVFERLASVERLATTETESLAALTVRLRREIDHLVEYAMLALPNLEEVRRVVVATRDATTELGATLPAQLSEIAAALADLHQVTASINAGLEAARAATDEHDAATLTGLAEAAEAIGAVQAAVEQARASVAEVGMTATQVATHIAEQVATVPASLAEISREVAEVRVSAELAAATSADLGARSYVNRSVGEVTDGCAELLNYAASHRGFDAQARLWFNPPVVLSHAPGDVRVGTTNERIVEVPFVFGQLARLPRGSRIVDFGALESTVALSLATLGHDVIALDLAPYPLQHPNLRSVVSPAETWEGPAEQLDAIISLSTLEHVGLGAYGEPVGEPDLDARLLDRFRAWLRPDGLFVMTAPFGTSRVTDLQRVYDDRDLDRLFERWHISCRQYAVQSPSGVWELISGSTANVGTKVGAEVSANVPMVALLCATPAPVGVAAGPNGVVSKATRSRAGRAAARRA